MHRTVINAGIDRELDELKRSYDGLEDLLDQTSQQIAATVPQVYNLHLHVIFFPQIGFLIAVPNDHSTGRGLYEGGDEEDTRWERIFSTADLIYYKDGRMRGLDDNVGDIYAAICGKVPVNMCDCMAKGSQTSRSRDRHRSRAWTTGIGKRGYLEHGFRYLWRARQVIVQSLPSQPVTDNVSLAALALGAKNYKFCRPQITAQNIVNIKGGR